MGRSIRSRVLPIAFIGGFERVEPSDTDARLFHRAEHQE